MNRSELAIIGVGIGPNARGHAADRRRAAGAGAGSDGFYICGTVIDSTIPAAERLPRRDRRSARVPGA
jgi:hypothetical protein